MIDSKTNRLPPKGFREKLERRLRTSSMIRRISNFERSMEENKPAIMRVPSMSSLRGRSSRYARRAVSELTRMSFTSWSTASFQSDGDSKDFIADEWKQTMQENDMQRFISLLRDHSSPDAAKDRASLHFDSSSFDKLEDDKELGALDRRLFSVAEVIVQEENYVDFLEFLCAVFLPAVADFSTNSLLKSYAEELIKDVMQIYQFHQDVMLPSFRESNDKWPEGPSFWSRIDELSKVEPNYASYYHQYEAFITMLDEETKKHSWGHELGSQVNLIDEKYRDCPLRGMTSVQSLLRPIQQLPRYRLHLKKFVDFADESDKQREDLLDKHTKLDTLIAHCNESIGLPFRDMMNLQERLTRRCQWLFLNPRRRLVHHGWVRKLNSRDGEPCPRYLILFSDVLVVCSSSLDTTGSSWSKLDTVHQMLPIDPKKEDMCYVERLNVSTLRVYFRPRVIDFSTENTREWINAFCSCGAVQSKPPPMEYPGQRAPVWQHDYLATLCPVCTRRFHKLNRRHHCRVCGRVVCGNCSKRRLSLDYTGTDDRVRTCDICNVVIQQKQRRANSINVLQQDF